MEPTRIEYNCQISKNRAYSIETDGKIQGVAVIKTACRAKDSKTEYRIFPDSVLLIAADNHIELTADGSDIIIDIMLFKSRSRSIKETEIISGMPCYEISEVIRLMKSEQLEGRYNNSEMCALYSEIVLKKLERLREEKKLMHKRHAFFKIREDIYNRPYVNRKVDDLIAESGLSRRQFYYTWKVIFNKTPLQDIADSRLEYAKILLTTTEMRICEITASCGYGSEQYFIQSFKKAVGVTPSKFRYDFTRWNGLTPRI